MLPGDSAVNVLKTKYSIMVIDQSSRQAVTSIFHTPPTHTHKEQIFSQYSVCVWEL